MTHYIKILGLILLTGCSVIDNSNVLLKSLTQTSRDYTTVATNTIPNALNSICLITNTINNIDTITKHTTPILDKSVIVLDNVNSNLQSIRGVTDKLTNTIDLISIVITNDLHNLLNETTKTIHSIRATAVSVHVNEDKFFYGKPIKIGVITIGVLIILALLQHIFKGNSEKN